MILNELGRSGWHRRSPGVAACTQRDVTFGFVGPWLGEADKPEDFSWCSIHNHVRDVFEHQDMCLGPHHDVPPRHREGHWERCFGGWWGWREASIFKTNTITKEVGSEHRGIVFGLEQWGKDGQAKPSRMLNGATKTSIFTLELEFLNMDTHFRRPELCHANSLRLFGWRMRLHSALLGPPEPIDSARKIDSKSSKLKGTNFRGVNWHGHHRGQEQCKNESSHPHTKFSNDYVVQTEAGWPGSLGLLGRGPDRLLFEICLDLI